MTPKRVFLVSLIVYTVTMGGHLTSGDGVVKVAWTRAILERGTSDVDPGPGVAYSKYGVGHTLLAVPPIAMAEVVRLVTGQRCSGLFYTYLFIVNGAWFLALVARYFQPEYPPRRIAAVVAILGLATIWWPYTKLDFSEPLVLTFLFSGFLHIRDGRTFRGLLVASVAATIRQDAALLIAVLVVWHLATTHRFRSAPLMMTALVPAVLVNLAANYARFGSFRDVGYRGEAFNNPLLVGLYGQIFSAGKSIFLFSPPLVLGFVGFKRFLNSTQGRTDGWFFLSVFLTELLLYAKWWDWSGDYCWGSRFMIPGVMLMTLPLVEVLDWRVTVAALTTLGVSIQLLAVLIGPLSFINLTQINRMERCPLYVEGGPRRLDMDDVRFNPRYSQIVGHWLMLRTTLGVPPQHQRQGEDQRIGSALYDTLPRETWRRNSNFDLLILRIFTKIIGIIKFIFVHKFPSQ